jgi:nicotinamide-nucleotide amidase
MTDIDQLSERTGAALQQQGLMLVTAESCTGGGVAQAITAIAGSSQWFERGFVTYTNTAKQEMLGVQTETLKQHGAVSEATVAEMVKGALQHSHAQVALAISGVAGPGGGSLEKPVGTVCFAWGRAGAAVRAETEMFLGNRSQVREQAIIHSLQGVLKLLEAG